MRGSQVGCHFYFDQMAVLMAVRHISAKRKFSSGKTGIMSGVSIRRLGGGVEDTCHNN
jgi:hypothetical protein